MQYRFGFEHLAAPLWKFTTRVVTPEEAAAGLIAAAEAPKGGQYFEGTAGPGKAAKQCYDEALQNYIWDDTAKLLQLEWPIPGLY